MTRLRAIPGKILTNYPPNLNCKAISQTYGFDHVTKYTVAELKAGAVMGGAY
jgi:hypothetical protein